MKPTQITELLANIKATFVSFFSIMMFVALGAGVFAGIFWVAPALEAAADRVFDEGSLHHFQLQFPYGLTEDDLAQLREVEGVTDVEEGYAVYGTYKVDAGQYTVKVQELGERIDVPRIVEGALPTKKNEVALKASSAAALNLGVGDKLTFEHDASDESDKDGMELLQRDTYKITGLVESSEYLALSSQTYGFSTSGTGGVDAVAWAPAAAFDADAFQEGYPVVNIRCASLEGVGTFTGEYDAMSEEEKARIAELGATLAPARYDALHDKAEKQVKEGEKKLKEAREQIADGKKKIKDGEKQLKQARIDLDAAVKDGEAKLADAYNKLQSGESQKAAAQKKLSAAQAKLNRAKAALGEVDQAKATARAVASEMRAYKKSQNQLLKQKRISQKKYNARLDNHGAKMRSRIQPYAKKTGVSVPKITHANYSESIQAIATVEANAESIPVEVEGEQMTIGQARKKVAQYEKQLSSAQATYNKKAKQLENGWAQYYAGQQELATKKAEGEKQIADGEAELKEAKKKLKEAKAEVQEKKPLLIAARKKVASLKKYDWSISDRATNGGSIEVSTFAGVTNRLSFSMAALFLIVGLLVSYSAIGRIVREQITQIGTKKALGLRKREITMSFLLYAGLAVIVGVVVGLVVAVFVVEAIIGNALSARFTFDALPPYFDIKLALIALAVELVLVVGAAWLACRTILKQQAVELLKGEKPPAGKTRFYEKWGIWQKLPLMTQTMVNNCVNDKKRVFSTLIGVAGCTALVVTAITLNNDVMKSYDMHYEDVYGFNAIAFVDPEVEGSADAVAKALEDDGHASAVILRRSQAIQQPDGSQGAVRIVVPADEQTFQQVYHVNAVEGSDVDLSSDGVWISQAYASHLGAKVGDELTINASDGTVRTLTIAGFSEFYLTYNELVMGRDAYEKAFEAKYVPNAVYSQLGDASLDEVNAKLAGVDGYSQIIDDKTNQYGNFAAFSKVSQAVVLIYLALAVLMAIVVLLNLNFMFIDEKKRELIVLMINGFSVKDAKKYIYNDTIVLTVLGIILGLVVGAIMGSITVGTIEPMAAFFFKGIDWTAILVGTAVTAVLSFIMSLIALRRIPAFKLTDINKL